MTSDPQDADHEEGDRPEGGEASEGAARHLPARNSWRLLLDPNFGRFFGGQLASTLGMWVQNIASAIVVYDLTRSAFSVGLVSVAQFLPQILLAPYSGSLADRGSRRLQLIAGRLIAAAAGSGLVLYILIVGLEGQRGADAIVIAALLAGVGYAVGGPAMFAVTPSLVRPSELSSAIARSTFPFSIGRSAGPALGALIVATLGPVGAYGFAVASNLLFALALMGINIQESPPKKPGPDSSVAAGLRYVAQQPVLRAALLGAIAIGIGADPVITLTPAIADLLVADATAVGLMASGFGVGAGLAFPTLSYLRRILGLEWLGFSGLVLLGSGLLALAMAPTTSIAIGTLLAAGIGMTYAMTSYSTIIQARVPEEFRGRIMALWGVAFLGSRPLSAAVSGGVADLPSPGFALSLVTLSCYLGAVIARPSRVGAS